MADPICRWRNATIKQLMEFNFLFPFEILDKLSARNLVEGRWNILGGENFFTTPYQLAAQMGLYYETNEYLYPRFSRFISIEEAQDYMFSLGKRYYAPNPYTKSLNMTETPININNFLVNWCLNNEIAKFSDALSNMFKEPIGNTDILVNFLNNFSEVSIINDIITLKENAPLVPYDEVFLNIDKNDKKQFFEYIASAIQYDYATRTVKKTDISSLQQIYYGAPGTGKSHSINEQTEGESVIRTTFHPDSDYSTFVGAYKPTTKQITLRDMSGHPIKEDGVVLKEDRIVYEFVDQAFLQAYVKAWKFYAENEADPKKQFLVIEEINRGNCAQIFGDLFQLLDRNEWGFSDYPINADKDMKKQLKKALAGLSIADAETINGYYKGRDVVREVLEGDILLLPNNLYIWATMNTSDQSLFPIDSAFKRRWDWQYMPIAQGRDKAGKELAWTIDVNGSKYSWWSFLEKINAQIGEATQSEDKKLGFFFCKAKDGVITPETFVGKVVFYLWNDVFKDYGFEGSIFKDKDGTELSFNKFYAADLKGNAVVQKDKVELFLNNLGVELVEEGFDVDNEDGEEYEEDKARVSDTNAPYRVTFPDGEIICEDSGWETYVASLQKIGLEKALPFGEMYSRLNKTLPLITKKKIADQGVYKYYEVDGYYILSGTDSQHRLLKRMNKDLNLGLKIE